MSALAQETPASQDSPSIVAESPQEIQHDRLQRAEEFFDARMYLLSGEEFARAFYFSEESSDVALRTAQAFDSAGSVKAIAYYNRHLSLLRDGEDASDVRDRVSLLHALHLVERATVSLVSLRSYLHQRYSALYEQPNTPITEFYNETGFTLAREVYGRMIEYYLHAARKDPAAWLPHARLLEISLCIGDEVLARGVAQYLQQRGAPIVVAANFHLGAEPLKTILPEQETGWLERYTTIPEINKLRRGVVVMDARGIGFYDRRYAGWFLKDRMALRKFATNYASITPFLQLEKSFVSDIDLKHDSNWTGDLWRSLMKIQTSRWYQIPQIMEFPTGDRSRVFLISPPDGFHVFAKERIATPLLAFGDRPTSKLTQHPRLWSRRLGIILKDYGGYANAVNFDNNKFVHKKIWYDVWCDRNHAFLLPMPDEDYLTWVRTASIRSEDELEAVTIARNRQFRETMRRRRFGRGRR